MGEEKTDAAYPRPFAETLREMGRGQLATELADELAALVAAVLEIGKPGSLTLKLTVKPTAKSDGMVTIADEVTVKPPKSDRPDTWYFADSDGRLSRDNPNQTRLPLSTVAHNAEES